MNDVTSQRSGLFARAVMPHGTLAEAADAGAFPALGVTHSLLPPVLSGSTFSSRASIGGIGRGTGGARPRLNAYTSLTALLVMSGQSHLVASRLKSDTARRAQDGSTQVSSLENAEKRPPPVLITTKEPPRIALDSISPRSSTSTSAPKSSSFNVVSLNNGRGEGGGGREENWFFSAQASAQSSPYAYDASAQPYGASAQPYGASAPPPSPITRVPAKRRVAVAAAAPAPSPAYAYAAAATYTAPAPAQQAFPTPSGGGGVPGPFPGPGSGPGSGPGGALGDLTSALAALPSGIDSFRSLSSEFRSGTLTASEYHRQMVCLFENAEAAAETAGSGLGGRRPLDVFSRAMRVLLEAIPNIGPRGAGCAAHDAWLAARPSPVTISSSSSSSSKGAAAKANSTTTTQSKNTSGFSQWAQTAAVAPSPVRQQPPPPPPQRTVQQPPQPPPQLPAAPLAHLSGTLLASDEAFPSLTVAPVALGAILGRASAMSGRAALLAPNHNNANAVSIGIATGGARSLAGAFAKGSGKGLGKIKNDIAAEDWADFGADDGSFRVALPPRTAAAPRAEEWSERPALLPALERAAARAAEKHKQEQERGVLVPATVPAIATANIITRAIPIPIPTPTLPSPAIGDGWTAQVPVALPRVNAGGAQCPDPGPKSFPSMKARLGPDRPTFRSEADLDRALKGLLKAAVSADSGAGDGNYGGISNGNARRVTTLSVPTVVQVTPGGGGNGDDDDDFATMRGTGGGKKKRNK